MATRQQLIEAKDAYHKLLTGKSVVTIEREGRKVEYALADMQKLQNYIGELENTFGGESRRRGPAGVF